MEELMLKILQREFRIYFIILGNQFLSTKVSLTIIIDEIGAENPLVQNKTDLKENESDLNDE